MGSYDSIAKNVHRATVLELAGKDGNILYIDDEDASMTKFCLARGVAAGRLVPVNKSSVAVASACGVCGWRGDIDQYLVNCCTPDSYGVVWLDYQSRTVRGYVLEAALRIAPFVMITLSTLREAAASVVERAVASVRAVGGEMPEDPVRYRGRSGIVNMVRVLVTRPSTTTPTVPRAAPFVDASLVGELVEVPIENWSNTSGYEDVRRSSDERRFVFKIYKTHRGRAFALRAIMKSGRASRVPEQWVLRDADMQRPDIVCGRAAA